MNDWLNAERHAERAQRFYDAGEWAKALGELQRALALHPDHDEWLFGMGMTLDAMERHEEAAACFEKVAALRGDDADVLLHLAIDLITLERYRDAVERLEAVREIDPENEASFCFRVLSYARMGDHDRAEQMFYLARQYVEDCPNCYDFIGESLLDRGMTDRAIWCWRQALRLEPHRPDVHRKLAAAYRQQGRLTLAKDEYFCELREDPGNRAALLDLGELLLEMNRPTEAAEKFRRVLEIDPTASEAHMHLGELQISIGHLEAAAEQFEIARRMDPDMPGVHLRLAEIAQRQGDRREQRRLLRAELVRVGDDPQLRVDLAQALLHARMVKQANTVLQELLADPGAAEGPMAAEVRFFCGIAAQLGRDHARAVAWFREALRYDPEHLDAMAHLVVAHLRLGRLKRARVWANRCLEVQPDNAALRVLHNRVRLARMLRPITRWWRRG